LGSQDKSIGTEGKDGVDRDVICIRAVANGDVPRDLGEPCNKGSLGEPDANDTADTEECNERNCDAKKADGAAFWVGAGVNEVSLSFCVPFPIGGTGMS